MELDYFSVLGLAPGRYAPAVVAAHFAAERQRLLSDMLAGRADSAAGARLDALHLAYGMLRRPEIQERLLAKRRPALTLVPAVTGPELDISDYALETSHETLREETSNDRDTVGERDQAVESLRDQIAASLEDGLLRHSRRQEIVAAAERAGVSEFHAHLLIAQVQFGESRITFRPTEPVKKRPRAQRGWASCAAAGVLALAGFLGALRWLGV